MPTFNVHCKMTESYRGELEVEASSPHEAQEKAAQIVEKFGVSSDDWYVDSDFNWDYKDTNFEVTEVR